MKANMLAMITAAIMLATTTAYADTATGFTDIPENASYMEAVEFCRENGLMSGTSDMEFSPGENTSRAMLVTILHRHSGSPKTAGMATFADVPADAWYYEAVNWGAANGMISGYSASLFAPDDLLTREQIIAILWRNAGSPSASGTVLPFRDAASISDYALGAVQWAYETDIIGGEANSVLNPTEPITRAEMAQMLYQYLKEDEPAGDDSPEASETPTIHVTFRNSEFDVVLYDSPTTQLLMTQVPETRMMLPTSYDLDGVCKYYDIPMSYHDALQIKTERIPSVKAGDLILDDNNRLYLYYRDSEVTGDFLRIGYVADTTDLAENLGSGSITFYVTQY